MIYSEQRKENKMKRCRVESVLVVALMMMGCFIAGCPLLGDLCANVTCDTGFTCNDTTGECEENVDPCDGVTCNDSSNCTEDTCDDTGTCVFTSICEDNELCVDGECVDLCLDVTCDEGMTCDPATGDCIDD